ncbi:structure-specific endonuclease subunit slx1-like isoform X2 [Varroa jacobsoni]|uniref:GIY-YIG domain-containing protein n=1 Tax=Varroa destructor TaxID=109461 RepID=A0A7M7K7I2_VARDE|nr:structure-specific endonuclease subunit slx1-like isoform X2 [Varroa destructor]XP_022694078.1 structure-specific endonuclease subunit slx1-like isoform X2 [Varroa jacobsoni]
MSFPRSSPEYVSSVSVDKQIVHPPVAPSSASGNFYGVYLLFCITPQFFGDTYIGFTVDPGRRIKQHNKGVTSGGAYTTNRKGSWEMTLVVHGFPNDKSALRFEWSWQHPKKSRRLAHVPVRRYKKETKFEHALRVLSVMLSVAPWKRLSLTLQWLIPKYIKELPLTPPTHMLIIREEVDLPKYSNHGKMRELSEREALEQLD